MSLGLARRNVDSLNPDPDGRPCGVHFSLPIIKTTYTSSSFDHHYATCLSTSRGANHCLLSVSQVFWNKYCPLCIYLTSTPISTPCFCFPLVSLPTCLLAFCFRLLSTFHTIVFNFPLYLASVTRSIYLYIPFLQTKRQDVYRKHKKALCTGYAMESKGGEVNSIFPTYLPTYLSTYRTCCR